jgi:two-component system, cell cycle sensor histidine kinase and response regulator CckA
MKTALNHASSVKATPRGISKKNLKSPKSPSAPARPRHEPQMTSGGASGTRESMLLEVTQAGVNYLANPEAEGALPKLLSRIGEVSGQDRFYLFKGHTDPVSGKKLISQRFEWVRPGLESQLGHPCIDSLAAYDLLPKMMGLLENGEIHQGLSSDLSPAEIGFLGGSGLFSFMRVPIRGRQGLWGFVGFDNCRGGMAWDSPHAAMLRLAADLVGFSAMRQQEMPSLGRSDEKFCQLFSNFIDPMLIFELDSLKFTDANEAALRILEIPDLASLRNVGPADISPTHQPDGCLSVDKAIENTEAAMRQGWNRFEWTHRSRTGRNFPVEVLLTPMILEGKQTMVVIWRDISRGVQDRDNAQIRLAALEAAANAIVITDHKGRILWTNHAFTRITGYTQEEAEGKNPRLLKSGKHELSFYKEMWDTIRSGRVWQGEMVNRRKDGSFYDEEMTITPVCAHPGGPVTHYVSVKSDVTEKKRLLQQFLRAQRSESLGTLAGGIAHDLNNILLPINLAADILKSRQSCDESLRMLDTISTCARRGADMVRQVLGYARGVEGRRVEVQLRHLIREMEKITKETFPRNISIAVHLPALLRSVEGDPTQIQQVLMNLCINARDAMPSGGTLTISVRDVVVDESLAVQHTQARIGEFVLIEVEDTGQGIEPAIIDRIFDPFFTTKEVGKGTGLGLSTVQSIVNGHHGFLIVSSRPGHGSRFQVYLPSMPVSTAEKGTVDDATPERGRGELVLVVDDEANVCNIVRHLLEDYGYRCLVAHDGAEALALYASHRFEIQVVLADMMMPVMDGSQMIQVLRRINPAVRVICSSGHATEERLEAANLPCSHFLPKPYESSVLLQKIRQVIDHSAPLNP